MEGAEEASTGPAGVASEEGIPGIMWEMCSDPGGFDEDVVPVSPSPANCSGLVAISTAERAFPGRLRRGAPTRQQTVHG